MDTESAKTEALPAPDPAPAAAPDSLIDAPAALNYWSQTPPTLAGILGGYPQISRTDLAGSRSFLAKLRRGPNGAFASGGSRWKGGVVDCGAGIGRVAGGFLKGVVDQGSSNSRGVDVVEPVGQFVDVLKGMKVEADGEADGEGKGWLEEVIALPLEDWTPTKKYDVFWNQWCLGHLTDRDLVAYLRRIKGWLTPPTTSITSTPDARTRDSASAPAQVQSYIVVKENLSTHKQLRGGVVFIDEVPKSPSGKILRKTVRQWAADERERPKPKL